MVQFRHRLRPIPLTSSSTSRSSRSRRPASRLPICCRSALAVVRSALCTRQNITTSQHSFWNITFCFLRTIWTHIHKKFFFPRFLDHICYRVYILSQWEMKQSSFGQEDIKRSNIYASSYLLLFKILQSDYTCFIDTVTGPQISNIFLRIEDSKYWLII